MSNRTSSHIELANSEPVPVAVYCQFLQSLYTTKEESRALRIVGIDLMKNVKKGAEHESLRATVRDCQGVLWYVYFERMRGPIAAPAPPSHATQSDTNLPRQPRNRSSFRISSPFHSSPSPSPSPSSSHSSSLASSDSFSKDRNALDVVTPLGKPSRPGEHSVLYLEFEENKGPFLYELAVLAATLHTSMMTYRLLSKNCYWYSGLLLNLLEMKHGLKAATKGGRHGTWKRYIRLYHQAEEAELRPVIDTFHFDLEAFEKTVAEKERRQLESQERLRDAAQGRETAESRARDEAQRREEAESRARDEAQRREEAESRARDDARGREEAESRARDEARGKEEAESRARDAEEELRRLRSVLKEQGISHDV